MTVRAIAFYLPQYHPVPENDAWWGPGFTEWTNVVRARPLFPGHYQPHLPADLGFYDLRVAEVREAQAALAREHGIHGFCYYHYWFNGRRILQRPFAEVLASGKPEFPFCLCWANENWTRAWDGGTKELLLEQHYSDADDRQHIRELIPALKDPRYIKIHGRPLLLIYRTELLPAPERTASIWRDEARKAGAGELYLARVENFKGGIDPATIGFDAAVEFSPNARNVGQRVFMGPLTKHLSRLGILPKAFAHHSVFRYSAIAEGKKNQPRPAYKQFRCVTPMWDNTPRRRTDGRILLGSTPDLYRTWLRTAIAQTQQRLNGDERVVFINAWNEWAEGCHLEPDRKWGHQYLAATKQALQQAADAPSAPATDPSRVPVRSARPARLRHAYWRAVEVCKGMAEIGRTVLRLPTQ